jgi:cytochrome o ubiquinol oxidase subunit 1
VFGFFAGLTYWFPKIFGFTLHDGLGKIAAWLWSVGFTLAFGPLFILGLMGATRRLNHYDEATGWQTLFIVAGVGAAIIGLGVLAQIAQVFISIRTRHKRTDTTGDPWNGRTLEWSTVSPAPHYNLAVIPTVTKRDPFWEAKQKPTAAINPPKYEDFTMPKNTGVGVIIGILSIAVGFGAVWHIWWMAILATLVIIAILIIRLSDDNTEYTIAKRSNTHEYGRSYK